MDQIIPENIVLTVPGYDADSWDYPKRCADLDLALAWAKERIEVWRQEDDPHGFWHERPHLIALYNAIADARRTEEGTE